MHKIGIYYNEPGIRNIMKGPEISNLEQQIMMERLSRVKAEFLQTFGFEGEFAVVGWDTHSPRSRRAYKIQATNARTNAALKKQPGWLGKFI